MKCNPSSTIKFYLGTHRPKWLGDARFVGVPLFVSARTLRQGKRWPRAVTTWALDSGGFSELFMYGEWRTSPEQYVREVRAWSAQIGGLEWAAIQDWMCEDFILEKTKLTLEEHQRRTVQSWVTLTKLAPEIPWAPVLQGFRLRDYLACADLYRSHGCNLRGVVGVGSVCRRQDTQEADLIFHALHAHLPASRLHGFGVKKDGLISYASQVASADSLAWSANARHGGCKIRKFREGKRPKAPQAVGCQRFVKAALEGRPLPHVSCANCADFALEWREALLAAVVGTTQPRRILQTNIFWL